jgi:ankyrin repeat protein
MKKKLWIVLTLLAFTAIAHAATNDLTGLLQKGLFEEEANRNLDAAISNYQTLANAFDKDRQVAATAIFRLGECYRKLGRTNEAAAQYQRIVRDFNDQQTLVTLSQQNLVGMGAAPQNNSEPGGESAALSNLRSQYALLKSQLEQARRETNSAIVMELFNDNKELAERLRLDLSMVSPDEAMLLEAKSRGGPAAITNMTKELKQMMDRIEADRQQIFDFQEIRLKSLEAAIKEQEGREGITSQDNRSTTSDTLQQLESALVKEQADYAQKNATLDTLKKLKPEGLIKALPTVVPDDRLNTLMSELDLAEQELQRLKPDFGETHPKIQNAKEQVDALHRKVDDRVDGIMAGLQAQLDASKAHLDWLKNEIQQARVSNAAQSANGEQPPITDEEEKEIRRIQGIIENSPDLINRPNTGPNGDWTLLYQAAKQGWLRVATFLLDHGANIEADSGQGYGGTPLDGAAESGNKAMVELLLSRGANVNASSEKSGTTALQIAASKGYVALAEALLAHNADVNATGSDKRTPLHIAASAGHQDIIKLLLTHGANANSTDEYGTAPLRAAAFAGHIDTVKTLLDAKANPNGGTRDLPLAGAIEGDSSQNRSNICELLLRAGADPNRAAPEGHLRLRPPFADDSSFTSSEKPLGPLYLAVARGQADIVELLLNHKADANAPGSREGTILTAAIQRSVTGIPEALLAHGADANARDGFNQTPLALAVGNGNRKVVESLLAHGAEVNAHSGPKERTALHFAAQAGNLELMELLILHKADVNAQDNDGKTALDYAKGQPWQPGGGLPQPPSSFAQRVRMMMGQPGEVSTTGAAPGPTSVSSTPEDVIKLLREHGALELPNFDAIRVTREGLSAPILAFERQSNDWNHYTLLETILQAYSGGNVWVGNTLVSPESLLKFPELKRIIIHRPNRSSLGKQKEITVDLLNSTNGIDCGKDVPVEFGDLVEVPIRDYGLVEAQVGLTQSQAKDLRDCLKTTVRLVVREEARELTLLAPWTFVSNTLQMPEAKSLLLASSDLAHVKVTRKDPSTGKTRKFIVDATEYHGFQDFRLQNGDTIEVPEKTRE